MKNYFLASVLILLLACGSNIESENPTSSRLRVAMRRAPDSYNPYISTSLEGQVVASRLYPTLFRETPEFSDGAPLLQPFLANSYAWDDSQTRLTLQLSQNRFWSDGQPVTAEDVAYTISLQINEEVAWISADRKAGIKALNVAGTHEIEIEFQKPSFFNLLDLNEGVIIPKHHFQRWPIADWQRDWSQDLVVYGPYRPQAGASAERFVLESLEPGILPDLVCTIVRDKETHYQLLHSGQADFSWTLPVARIPEIRASLQPVFYPENSFGFIGWNPIDPAALASGKPNNRAALSAIRRHSPHPVFGDVRVRRAMAYALNRKGYIERFWYGTTTVPATPWQAGLPYHRSTVQAEPYAPDKAAALLNEAGWPLVDGQRRKKGQPLRFTVISVSGSDIREQYLLAMQHDLAQAGIVMEIEFQEASRFIQNCVGGTFDAMLGLFQTPSRPDFSSLYHSQSQYNFTSWIDVDDTMARVHDASDGETLRAELATLEAAFRQACPLTPLYCGVKVGAARPGLAQRANYLDPLYAIDQWALVP